MLIYVSGSILPILFSYASAIVVLAYLVCCHWVDSIIWFDLQEATIKKLKENLEKELI